MSDDLIVLALMVGYAAVFVVLVRGRSTPAKRARRRNRRWAVVRVLVHAFTDDEPVRPRQAARR